MSNPKVNLGELRKKGARGWKVGGGVLPLVKAVGLGEWDRKRVRKHGRGIRRSQVRNSSTRLTKEKKRLFAKEKERRAIIKHGKR